MNRWKLFLVLTMALVIILVPVFAIAAPALAPLPIDKDGILLLANLPTGQQNVLKVSTPPVYGWYMGDFGAATNFTWRFTPDNSGVYQMVKHFTLGANVVNLAGKPLLGLPARSIWVFQGVKPGKGVAKFELFAVNGKTPVRTDTVLILVK